MYSPKHVFNGRTTGRRKTKKYKITRTELKPVWKQEGRAEGHYCSPPDLFSDLVPSNLVPTTGSGTSAGV